MSAQKSVLLILPMLALSAVVTLCGMPSAYSFELSCADQGSKLDQPYDAGDPIETPGTLTCAPLTSPRALDLIVSYQPAFLSPLLSHVYFYAYNHKYDAKDDNSGPMYTIITLPKSLAKGDNDLYKDVRSTQEYFGEVFSNNCVIREFFLFGQSSLSSMTLLIAIRNVFDHPSRRGLPGTPTKMTAFVLKKDIDGFAFEGPVATKVLGSYFCTYLDLLAEVEAFRTDIVSGRIPIPKE